MLRRLLLAITVVILIAFLCRGWLYRKLVVYETIGQRTTFTAGTDLRQWIDAHPESQSATTIDDIIALSLALTSQQLHFTIADNSTDPNVLVTSKAAHCVGYAQFFSSTCNYLIKKKGLQQQWIAVPKKGQLYVLGSNIHSFTESAFWKDHDFVAIQNKKTGEVLAVDPTVFDYLGIERVNNW